MTYTLITQLGLLAFLLTLFGWVCYERGKRVGIRLGIIDEQAFNHRRAILVSRKANAPWIHSRN
jgi:hypothetical protein